MTRGTNLMHREVVRTSAASGVAIAVMAAALLAATSLGVDLDAFAQQTSSAMALALVFRVYGLVFLAFTMLAFRGLRGDRLRAHVLRSEERSSCLRWLLLLGPKSWATIVIVVGIYSVVLLATGGIADATWIVWLCVLGVGGTWVLMVAVFAVESMRSWAADDSLEFPGSEERSFRDFLYLSVQQTTTFSSSDVRIVRGTARGIAMVHSVVAFACSTAIIAVFASLLIAIAG